MQESKILKMVLSHVGRFKEMAGFKVDAVDVDILNEVFEDIKINSIPWYNSTVHFGHMIHSIMPISYLSQCVSMLYNSNNVCSEVSPVTSRYEAQVINDFSEMAGYGERSAGSFLSCGTSANLQALYTAKCAKNLLLKILLDNNVDNKCFFDILYSGNKNFPLDELSEMLLEIDDDDLHKIISRFDPNEIEERGVLVVSESCHYSVKSSARILGIPSANIINVSCNEDLTMNMPELEKILIDLSSRNIPIIALVCVLGTTENGTFDNLYSITNMREKLNAKYGSSFWIHADAAYGGYAKTLVMNEENKLINKDEFFINNKNNISTGTYDTLSKLNEADSITIDPHKMGFINYGSAIHLLKNNFWLRLIEKSASYVFEDNGSPSHGVYNIEGSRPGAMPTAVYVANKKHPLNNSGYGKIILNTIQANRMLCKRMVEFKNVNINGNFFNIKPITINPEFNATLFYVTSDGMSIEEQNNLNRFIYENSIYNKNNAPDFYFSSSSIKNNEKNTYVIRGIIMDENLNSEEKISILWKNMSDHIISKTKAFLLNNQ